MLQLQSLVIRHKILDIGWDIFLYLWCSSGLTSSDHHLIHSLKNFLTGENVNNIDVVKTHLIQFFTDKARSFINVEL